MSFSHPRKLVCISTLLSLAYGCSEEPKMNGSLRNYPLKRTVRDERDAPRLNAADKSAFRLVFQIGSALRGYDIIDVNAEDRECEYTFRQFNGSRRRVEKRCRFLLAKETIAELEQFLDKIDFYALPAEYHADVRDGTQIIVCVTIGKTPKKVYCDNHFPYEITKLYKFVVDRILKENSSAIDVADVIDETDKKGKR